MHRRTVWLVVLAWLVGLSAVAHADGMILPDRPELGWLSVVYHDVEITVRDGVVTTRVDQLFRNDTGRDLEGRYVFPLSPGAVVSSFTMWVDGEALEAQILDADEARSIYEEYVRRAIDPALLEYVGRDTLSARIYPIPAGGGRRIEIVYSELLSAESGTYRYRYPLDTERFSARPLDRVSIAVDLKTVAPLSAIYSPTHALEVVRTDEYAATAQYVAYDVRPAQDFLLYYAVRADAMGMTLLTYRVPGEDGTFLLIATPPDIAGAAPAIPKDLVFVLDTSGSMSGGKIEQAKEALRFVVENLNPDDRFAVVAFSDAVAALRSHLVEVSAEAISEATSWTSTLSAAGGTNIDEALSLALSLFEANDRPRFLIFLTDGEPTTGETDPAAIAAHALEANGTAARLFVFGVGNDVNTILLDQLARENRGTTTYVLHGENLEVAISGFYRKIASPVLADPVLAIDGADVFDVYPTVLPDVFRGTQLIVVGRYRGDGDARVTVSGTADGVPTAYTTNQSFPYAALEDTFLPRLWAGRAVSHLLNLIRLYGESDELVDEVVRLSRRYGIITPYTSFLVEEGPYDAEEAADAVRQSTAAPATGANAVAGSSSLKALSEAETVQAGPEGVRIVDDRTYFFREETWIDSDYADEETIDVVLFSDAYFDLLEIVPWIGPHLAIGDKLVVRIGEVFVRIGDEGSTELTDDIAAELAP